MSPARTLATALLFLLLSAAPAHALEQTLVASDGAASDFLGTSVAVDGDIAVVGAYQDWDDSPGLAYVFTRVGDTWTQTARLSASDSEVGDRFGTSVAIDGDTIVVGAPGHIVGTNDSAGAVYTFARAGESDRTETGKLTVESPAMTGGQLGVTVAIDGDVIAAGALADSTVGTLSHGAVYLFDRTGDAERTETARLLASDRAAGDQLGSSLAIDGDTIVAGAPYKDGDLSSSAGFHQGAAYTFDSTDTGTADQTAKLDPSDDTSLDQFGKSADVQGDTIVVGASRDSVTGANYRGSAYTFDRTGSTSRPQTSKLHPADGVAEDEFGWEVGIDGTAIAVGSRFDDTPNLETGSVYTFPRIDLDENPTSSSKLFMSNPGPNNDWFGSAVDVDGGVIIAGAPGDDVGTNSAQGSAKVFFASATTPACSDGGDNDGDGLVDGDDPGCSGPEDTSEVDPPTGGGPKPPSGGGGGGGSVFGGNTNAPLPPRIVRPRRVLPAKVNPNGRFKMRLRIYCTTDPKKGPCNVRTYIFFERDTSASASKRIKLGSSRFKIPSGKSIASVPGKLSRKGLRRLKRSKRLRAKVRVTVKRSGARTATETVNVLLKAPKRRR